MKSEKIRMNKQDIYEIREWVKQELELAHTSNPPTFPMKVRVLEKILVMTTEIQINSVEDEE